jgi:hypothetical protein
MYWLVFVRSKSFGRILFLSLLFAICMSDSPAKGWEAQNSASEVDTAHARVQENQEGFNLGAWLVSFFREHISAVDGDRCPCIPSCSSYSVSAFKKHGFFVGWLMTVDRLIHEGDEGAVSPLIIDHGQVKVLDPVENNDFWWFGRDGESQD